MQNMWSWSGYLSTTLSAHNFKTFNDVGSKFPSPDKHKTWLSSKKWSEQLYQDAFRWMSVQEWQVSEQWIQIKRDSEIKVSQTSKKLMIWKFQEAFKATADRL